MIMEQNRITKKLKGIIVFNGKPTREWLSRKDTSSPTASLEGVFLTATINTY